MLKLEILLEIGNTKKTKINLELLKHTKKNKIITLRIKLQITLKIELEKVCRIDKPGQSSPVCRIYAEASATLPQQHLPRLASSS